MKTIFLGLSLAVAMLSFSFSSNDGDTVNVCTLIDELVTEINAIETISNKTNYLKKLESAKSHAEKQNWPMVKENMNSSATTVNSSSVTALKVSQKSSLYTKSNSIIEAVNKKKAACK
jgi:hypothetical protein